MKVEALSPLYVGAICAVLSPGLCGCGGGQDTVVAEVGSARITLGELQQFVTDLPPGLRSKKQGMEARLDHLQTLVDRELMRMEIQAQRLDTVAAVMRPHRKKVRDRAIRLYRVQEGLQVTEEEIQQRIAREGLDRVKEREAWGIMTETRADLDRAIRELEAGGPFEEVASKYSTTPQAEDGGRLGFISARTAMEMGVPDTVFSAQPLGEVSKPLPHSNGFFVIRFSQERTIDPFRFRDRVKKLLHSEKTEELLAARTEILAREFDWQPNEEGLDLLLEKARGASAATLSLSPEEEETPLFRFDGGQVTIGDFLYELRSAGATGSLGSRARALSLAQQLVTRPSLLYEGAKRSGVMDDESIREWEREKRNQALLTALRKREVTDDIPVPEEEIRKYYEEHTDRFFEKDSYSLKEVLVAAEGEAAEVRREAQAGSDLAEIARARSLRPEVRAAADGMLRLHMRDRVRFPRLAEAVKRAEMGQLVGPVQVYGGYSVFEVVDQAEGQLLPFEEVEPQIRGLLRRQYEQEGFRDFIEGLQVKYADQVRIHEDRLTGPWPEE